LIYYILSSPPSLPPFPPFAVPCPFVRPFFSLSEMTSLLLGYRYSIQKQARAHSTPAFDLRPMQKRTASAPSWPLARLFDRFTFLFQLRVSLSIATRATAQVGELHSLGVFLPSSPPALFQRCRCALFFWTLWGRKTDKNLTDVSATSSDCKDRSTEFAFWSLKFGVELTKAP